MEKVRIDKWLWAVRIYKTRSLAADACKKGRVMSDGVSVKPSREIKIGEVITIRKLPVVYTYKVLKLAEKRMSAKIIPEYLEDITSIEELNKLKINETFFIKRERGAGRPTKKERRLIEKLKDSNT